MVEGEFGMEEGMTEQDWQDRLSGHSFNVDTTTFRCVEIIGVSTGVFECNTCSSLVSDPERHLKAHIHG